MNLNSFLLIALCTALLAVLFFITKLRRVRGQLSIIEEALEDIKSGNPNRRVLARKSDMTKRICYAINEIAVKNQSQLIQQKQSEQAYKRLMTSLSHDVKTPLASLFGYLDAVENGLVAGEEKEAYIHVAVEKACHLKHFVEALFEWVKLDAKEQVFHFELCDFNELTAILSQSGFQPWNATILNMILIFLKMNIFFVLTLIPIPAFLIICFKMCLCTVAAIN